MKTDTPMTSIAESHSPKHQPPRSPNPSSGISGRRRSTDKESSNMQQNANAASSSGSRYITMSCIISVKWKRIILNFNPFINIQRYFTSFQVFPINQNINTSNVKWGLNRCFRTQQQRPRYYRSCAFCS